MDLDGDGLPRCPDLFFRTEPGHPDLQTRFGLTAKHVPGVLLADPSSDAPRHLHVRATNRGLVDFGGVARIFTMRPIGGGDYAVAQLDERDVLAGPGEFVVAELVAIPDGPTAVLVEILDPGEATKAGTYSAAQLVDLVANNRGVGILAVPRGA